MFGLKKRVVFFVFGCYGPFKYFFCAFCYVGLDVLTYLEVPNMCHAAEDDTFQLHFLGRGGGVGGMLKFSELLFQQAPMLDAMQDMLHGGTSMANR